MYISFTLKAYRVKGNFCCSRMVWDNVDMGAGFTDTIGF
jgi:hypothetical protein